MGLELIMFWNFVKSYLCQLLPVNILRKKGFCYKHNTSQPLIDFTKNIVMALNTNKFYIAIFIDHKKAFETVNFHILLPKCNIRESEMLSFWGSRIIFQFNFNIVLYMVNILKNVK